MNITARIQRTLGKVTVGLLVMASSAIASAQTASYGGLAIRPTSTLTIPGNQSFPETVAAAPDGTLYVSSIAAGAIFRLPAGSTTAEPFLAPGSRPGVAGVLYDYHRKVVWACIVDLSGATASTLEALDPISRAVVASYLLPSGLCADIALGGDNQTVYVTDTIGSQILRLMTPPNSATGGTLAVWANEPILATPVPGVLPLGLNGIAYDPLYRTLYVGKYNSGQLFSVRVRADGTAAPAKEVVLNKRYPKIDGIRLLAPGVLLAAVNYGPVLSVGVVGSYGVAKTVGEFDQPSSLAISPDGIWVAEGQVVRLQGEDSTPVNLPFKLRRLLTSTVLD